MTEYGLRKTVDRLCIQKYNNKYSSTDSLINLLNDTEIGKYDKVIIVGDFNYPDITWNCLHNCTTTDIKFINCLQDNFYAQMITEPTRHRVGQKSNLLDLVLTRDESLIK